MFIIHISLSKAISQAFQKKICVCLFMKSNFIMEKEFLDLSKLINVSKAKVMFLSDSVAGKQVHWSPFVLLECLNVLSADLPNLTL